MLQHCGTAAHIPVKLPGILPGAPLIFNGAPGNIQGNFTVYIDIVSISSCDERLILQASRVHFNLKTNECLFIITNEYNLTIVALSNTTNWTILIYA